MDNCGWILCWCVCGRDIILFVCLRAMKQRQPGYAEQVKFSQQIKEFLAYYKTNFCLIHPSGYKDLCNEYHSEQQRRRNPYKEHGFLYYPSDICQCNQQDCQKCHNQYEQYYHPLYYKVEKCTSFQCNLGLYCYMALKSEADMIMRYQFFRFDLETFKTEECPYRQQTNNTHQLASCLYNHNESDRRRNPRKVAYSHVQCSKQNCNNPNCPFAHNKIEQLYHPSRYKTKYCQSFVNNKVCQYYQYCSFAHSNSEIKIELLHDMPKNQAFYDYKYKTVWCPYTTAHDRSNCTYAHNFQDYRRDPKKKNYTPEACQNWIKGEIKSIEDSGCPLRMECPKSHGWLERKFHPDLKKLETGDIKVPEVEQPAQLIKENDQKKVQNEDFFGPGAPFFKQEQKIIEHYSSVKKVFKEKTKEKPISPKVDTSDLWNSSVFVTIKDIQVNENGEAVQPIEKQIQACWQINVQSKNEKEQKCQIQSPLKRSKIWKGTRTDSSSMSSSMKQLLGSAGLLEKMSTINQIKLLTLPVEELDKFGLNQLEKQRLVSIIKEYSTTHRLDKVKYTDSMVKIFRGKYLLKTLQKLKNKKVSQTYLQNLNSSTIEELSFLEKEQKASLPKILEQYADDRDFRELNTLIKKQQQEQKQTKASKQSKQRRYFGRSKLKT